MPDSNAKQLIRPTPFLVSLPEVAPVATGLLSTHHAWRQGETLLTCQAGITPASHVQTILFLYSDRFQTNIAGNAALKPPF